MANGGVHRSGPRSPVKQGKQVVAFTGLRRSAHLRFIRVKVTSPPCLLQYSPQSPTVAEKQVMTRRAAGQMQPNPATTATLMRAHTYLLDFQASEAHIHGGRVLLAEGAG